MTVQRRAPAPGIAAMAVGALVLVALVTAGGSGLRINGSASMPRGLWRVAPVKTPLVRGAVVTVCPPDKPPFREAAARGYIPAGSCPGDYEPLVKPVGALPGDVVAISASGVAVNSQAVPGTGQLTQDSAGRALRPVQAGIYVVQPDELWLLSGHDPRSFDSRYFGPVPMANVQGSARPVWVLP